MEKKWPPLLPPDVGFGHDALKSITKFKERLNLWHKETNENGDMRNNGEQKKKNRWPAYLHEAVESVNSWELKVQAEKVKGDDADDVSLRRAKENAWRELARKGEGQTRVWFKYFLTIP